MRVEGTLTCIDVHSSTNSGSSHPVIALASDGKKYLIKLRGGLSGSFATLNEWVCLKMAKALGLPVLDSLPMLVTEETNCVALYIENRELVKKSIGLNVAFPYYEGVKPFRIETLNVAIAQQLLLFDLFTVNMDRTAANPNIVDVNGVMNIIDFEGSLLVPNIVQGKNLLLQEAVKRQLRNHICFDERISKAQFQQVFHTFQEIDFDAILHETPTDWYADKISMLDLCTGLQVSARNIAAYWEFYSAIKLLPKELDGDRTKRIIANRDAYNKSFLL